LRGSGIVVGADQRTHLPNMDPTWMSNLFENLEFVFVHSYSSRMSNWRDVMLGDGTRCGRLARAQAIARELDLSIIADDASDQKNRVLYQEAGLTNIGRAYNTADEVRHALDHSRHQAILFVTSPDHLPRVVRDVLAHGATQSLFMASEVPFSGAGAGAILIEEPRHMK